MFSIAVLCLLSTFIYFILQLLCVPHNLQPEIEFHVNDLYFNNISFAFSRSFLLQLFKLNCNCFPLNAVVALDVVVRLPRLFKLNSSGMNRKKTWIKKCSGKNTAKNLQFFEYLFALELPTSELLSSEIIQPDIFLHFNTYSLKNMYLNIISMSQGCRADSSDVCFIYNRNSFTCSLTCNIC
jgi:hypothetical protein